MQYKKQVKKILLNLGGISFALVSGFVLANDSSLTEYPSVDFNTRIKFGVISEDDRSLGRDNIGNKSTVFGVLQPKMGVDFNDSWSAFTFAEFFAADDVVDLNDDYASTQSDGYASLRELWFGFHGLSRYPGESIRFGIERFRESSSLWWDRSLLLARWQMDTTKFKATVGAGEQKNVLSTRDANLSILDEGRQRFFSSIDYQWRYQHWLGFKLIHSADQVDNVDVFSDKDIFRRQDTWLGVSANRDYFTGRIDSELSWQYSFDVMALMGRAERFDAQSAVIDVDVQGWAVDIGLRKRFDFKAPVFLGGHFAYASGGDGNAKNNTFYQTGLHTNRNRFAGTRSMAARFGEVLRSDLSNMSIATFYLTNRIGSEFEWSVVAHKFSRVDDNQFVKLQGISVPPDNGGTDIGSEIDLLIAYHNRTRLGVLSKSSLSFRVGYFNAGDAYSTMPNEGKYRIALDLQKQF